MRRFAVRNRGESVGAAITSAVHDRREWRVRKIRPRPALNDWWLAIPREDGTFPAQLRGDVKMRGFGRRWGGAMRVDGLMRSNWPQN